MRTLDELGISPSPWIFAHDDGHSIVASFHGTPIVIYSFKDEKGIAKADARLIAAAPQLYDALGHLVSFVASGKTKHGTIDERIEYSTIMKDACLALAKASGEEDKNA